MKPTLLFLLYFSALSLSCKAQTTTATIAFTGDIMMHYAVKGSAQAKDPDKKGTYTVKGFNTLYAANAPVLRQADFAVGNMEFPVSPPFIQKEFIFNCPPEVIPSLKETGFDLVSLANNHILDQGIKGAHNTMQFLEKAGLQYFGAGKDEKGVREGAVFEKNGIRIGVAAYAGLLNYPFPPKGSTIYVNNLNEKAEMIADIKRLKERCDFLIVQPHAGVEYTLSPTEEQRRLYREIIDAGADMIVGHHPHTLQYAEEYVTAKGKHALIFYSLGNFVCNQSYTYPIPGTKERMDIRNSVIVHVTLLKKGSAIEPSVRLFPSHTMHAYKTLSGRNYKDIQNVMLADEIRSLKAQLANKKSNAAAQKQLSYFSTHMSAIQKVLFKKGIPLGVTIDTGE